jgi:hypothetical protein
MLGGASRAGKSIISREFLVEENIPYFSLDFLMMSLVNGMPALGIDPDEASVITGEKMWPLVEAMAANIIDVGTNYLIEGDTLLPKHVHTLVQRYGPTVRACFVGYTAIEPHIKLKEIRKFRSGSGDWVRPLSDTEDLDLIRTMIEFSRYLRSECTQYNLPYFDNSNNFIENIYKVLRHLKSH